MASLELANQPQRASKKGAIDRILMCVSLYFLTIITSHFFIYAQLFLFRLIVCSCLIFPFLSTNSGK